jgi:hypothetical protein
MPSDMRESVLIISLIGIMMILGGLISFSPVSIEKQMPAEAQSINDTVPTVSSNRNLENITFPGQTIVHRGMVSSEEPNHVILPPGEEPHAVSILPHREDGASYAGVLTFTATEPVEIGLSHRLDVDNSTLSQLDPRILDNLLLGQQTNRTEKGLPGVIAVPSVIIPDYGTQPPYFSASLPFAASSVWLRTPHGEPFIAIYEVVAEVVQPQAFVADIENATSGMGVNMSGVNMSGVNMSGVNMSDSLSQNITNRTESENMTQQQQEETSNGQTNATATTEVNTTNQSGQEQQQEQEQNNGNPLSDIPIIGELFGG